MSLMPLGTQGIRSPGRPAPPPPPPPPEKLQAEPLRRVDSSSSDSSVESQATAIPAEKPQQLYQSAKQGARQNQIKSRSDEAAYGSASASQNFSRPTPVRVQFNAPRSGNTSPSAGPGQNRHLQTTQHGQGFFEPSLPTTSASGQPQAHGLSASRAAAQAAMQQQSSQQLLRQRSQTVGNVEAPAGASSVTFHSKPSTPTPGALEVYGVPTPTSARAAQSRNGSVSAFPGTAATAASAAYPRSLSSAGLPSPDRSAPVESKERKPKTESKSKMKLFSKPKSIGISRDKEAEKKDKPLPSPNKMGIYGPSPLPQIFTASTTSLADSVASGPASTIYSTRNNSTATLIPATNETNPTSDRHKHNFLSRQKLKLRDKDEGSSSAVNTKAAYPNPPAPLYTFTPSSPAPSTASFSKTGLDLRHGGRALREKKREEKASAAAAAAAAAANTIGFSSVGYSARDDESLYSTSDWPVPVHVGGGPGMTIPAASKAGSISLASGNVAGSYDSALQVNLQGQGLAGMTPDDAWPFLKAKLLVIFEGEDMRVTVEDCNTLLLAHIQRCVQHRAPNVIMNDLAEMLCNGFSLLDHTLRRESEERLIPGLVELWLTAFGNILPCIQAVFLPLDLEFKGLGTILGAREAQEFWGALPGDSSSDRPLGDMLDVRRMVLVAFRDIVILSRYNRLQAVFSRLSLESINGSFDVLSNDSPGSNSGGDTVRGGAGAGRRPDTAASLDPGGSSYNSQSSTLLNDSGGSMGARSRTASNTSSAFGGGGGARASSPATEPVTSPISQYPSTPTAQIPPAPSQRQPAPPPSSSSTHANPSISVPRTSGTSSTIMPARTATMANRPSGPEHAPPPPQPHLPSSQDGTRLTETVGRMLQCVSVLASLRSADEAQDNMEELAKALKHNWLGRGRTGRNRRGFVGTKVVGGRERL